MPPRTAQEKLAHLLHLCKQPGCQRSQEDVWFIRDRLHECSSFFRLWPSTLQQLLCRLVQAKSCVQHEVLAAAGSKPEHLCFIVDGQAAVAVRAAPGSSLLKDVAILQAGDTFGELCLLGKERHHAFVVARSSLLTVLVVNAQVLAAAMPAALQQASAQPQGRPSGAKASSTSSSTSGGGCPSEAAAALQQQDSVSVDALYQLIGQPRQQPVRLKPGQADQVRQLYSRQLQEAAAAEAATVGTWQQLPHQRISSATGTQGRPATAARSRPAAAAPQAAGQGVLYEVRLGDELACAGTTAAGASRVQAGGSAECRQEAGALDVQTGAKQGADSHVDGVSAQQEERQQEKSNRSPLMHHTAIMHFAALRAAAVGQPHFTASSL